MSGFNVDDYLKQKFGAARVDPATPTKLDEIRQAKRDKIAGLERLAEDRAANQFRYENSAIGRMGLNPDGLAGRAVNSFFKTGAALFDRPDNVDDETRRQEALSFLDSPLFSNEELVAAETRALDPKGYAQDKERIDSLLARQLKTQLLGSTTVGEALTERERIRQGRATRLDERRNSDWYERYENWDNQVYRPGNTVPPSYSRPAGAADIIGAGLVRGTTGVAQSFMSLPEFAVTVGDGVAESLTAIGRAIGVPEELLEPRYVAPHDLIRPIARGFEVNDFKVAGTNDLSDAVKHFSEFFVTEAGKKSTAEIEAKTKEATAQLEQGDFSGLTDVLADPAAWSYYIPQALPSLLISMRYGLKGIAALETGGSAAGLREQQSDPTKEKAGDSAKAMHLLQSATIGILLEKLGVDSIIYGWSRKARQELGEEAAKKLNTGLGDYVKRVGSGAGGETLTEVGQAISGNVSTKMHIDREQPLLEGVIEGGMGGFGTGGGAAGVRGIPSLVSGLIPDRGSEDRSGPPSVSTDTPEYRAAVGSNDPSIYLDPDTPQYSPFNAAKVLHAHASQEGAATDVIDSNAAQIDEIIQFTQEDIAEAEKLVKYLSPEEGIPAIEKKIKAVEQRLEQLPETETTEIERLTAGLAALNSQIENAESIRKGAQTSIERYTPMLEVMSRLRDDLIGKSASRTTSSEVTQLVEAVEVPSTPETQASTTQSAERLMTLSMASPDAVTPEVANRLANNPNNALTDAQRQYFRRFSEARQRENALKDAHRVSQEVYYGREATKNSRRQVGLREYREGIGRDLAVGNRKAAQKKLSDLRKFSQSHTGKAAATRQALNQARADNSEVGFSIAPVENKEAGTRTWEVNPGQMKTKDRSAFGAVNVHLGSQELVDRIGTEAEAIASTLAELDAAVELRFGKEASTQAPAAETGTEVVPTPAKRKPLKDRIKKEAKQPKEPETKKEETKDDTTSVDTRNADRDGDTGPSDVDLDDVNRELAEAATEDTVVEDAPTDATKEQESTSTLDPDNPQGKVDSLSKRSEPDVPYNERNLAADLEQVPGKDTDKSLRPLVMVKDFFSSVASGAVKVTDFIAAGTGLSEKQQNALSSFWQTTNKWHNRFTRNLLKTDTTKFHYADPMQFLLTEVGGKVDLDENVKTALSAAIYTWIAEQIPQLRNNTDDVINSMLGRPSGAYVPLALKELFTTAGGRYQTVSNDIGRRASQALGFRSGKAVPKNVLPLLEGALGDHAVRMMLQSGLLTRQQVMDSDLEVAMDSGKEGNPHHPHNFLGLNINSDNKEVQATLNQIKESVAGSGSVLSKLFGVEEVTAPPSREPIPYIQKSPTGTEQGVPKMLRDLLKKKNAEGYKAARESHKVLSQLDRQLIYDMAGFKPVESQHVGLRVSQQAKNEAIIKDIDNYFDYLAENTTPEAWDMLSYFPQEVWRQHRVGMASGVINPQQSKSQRFLFNQDTWTNTVDLSNEDSKKDYLLGLAEAFGQKLDRNMGDTVATKMEQIKQLPAVLEAVDALVKVAKEDNYQLTADEKQAVLDMIDFGGQGLHTLQALQAMAQEAIAKEEGKTTFDITLLSETDGVTNGPILSHLLLGVGYSPDYLQAVLNRGGMYFQDGEHTQFNEWKTEGNLDLYENTIFEAAKQIQSVIDSGKGDASIFSSIWEVTGSWFDADTDTVTGDGRDIIKKPVQAISFGSSLNTVTRDMADAFIETIYGAITDLASMDDANAQERKRAKLVDALNTILATNKKSFSRNRIPENISVENLMNMRLNKYQQATIKKQFRDTVGASIREAVEFNFEPYLEARNQLKDVANNVHHIHRALYQAMRNAYIKELGIPITKAGEPAYDLTPEQERTLEKRLKTAAPLVHSPMSKLEGNKQNGILVNKSENQFGESAAYSGQTRFAKDNRGLPERVTNRGMERVSSAPGVRMLAILTHSLDSFISHRVQEKFKVLNLHDAIAAGHAQQREIAQALNEATWEALMMYSPLNEVYDTLVDTVLGVHEVLTDPNVSEEVQKDIIGYLQKTFDGQSLTNILDEAKGNAAQADRMKFATLKVMQSIDQYAREGGNFVVTDAHRDEAAAKEQKVDGSVAKSVLDRASEIDVMIRGGNLETSIKSTVDSRNEDSDAQSPQEARLFNLSPARVLALVDHLITDEATPKNIKESLLAVRKEMSKGKSLRDAVIASLEYAERGEVIHQITTHYDSIPENFWGEQEPAKIESDPRLVDIFESRGVLTKDQMVNALGGLLTNAYEKRLLKAVSRVLNPDLKFRYITPTTSPRQVMSGKVDNSRGWYTVKAEEGREEIYVLSPEFAESGLTPELILHEMVHGALAQKIEAELKAKEADKNYTSPAYKRVEELQAMLEAARKHVKEKGIEGHTNALSNIQEFVSWGMTNQAFQREVLATLEYTGNRANAAPKGALRQFIIKLADLLYSGLGIARTQDYEALAVLVSNTANLMAEANQRPSIKQLTLFMQNNRIPVLDKVRTFSTQTLFDALGSTQNRVLDPAFSGHLKDVLSRIVEKVHGPFGVLKADLMKNQPLTAEDTYLKAINTGVMPFASSALASGFSISQQEAFVLEQVEVTVRQAIEHKEASVSRAYRELVKTYQEARRRLKPKDFYDGDWSQAQPHQKAEAQALHDFVFDMQGGFGDRADYLSRFAALGIAHEGFNKILQGVVNEAPVAPKGNQTLVQRLRNTFEAILDYFNEKFAHTPKGMTYDRKLVTLVDALAQIETKKQSDVVRRSSALLRDMEDLGNRGVRAAKDVAVKAITSEAARNSKNAFVRAVSSTTAAIDQGRFGKLLDGIQSMKDMQNNARPGFIMGTFNDMRGALPTFQALHRASKHLQQLRQQGKENIARFMLDSFANNGEDLTEADKASITNVVLRSNLGKLLDNYSVQEIYEFVSDPAKRKRAIAHHNNILLRYPKFWEIFNGQIKALAFERVTGVVTIDGMMHNTENIARMLPYSSKDALHSSDKATVKEALDALLPLYALEYAHDTSTLASVFKKELDRNGENGIELVMKYHQHLLRHSRKTLFDGSEALVTDGYVPEIYNPHIDIRAASDEAVYDKNGNVISEGEGTTLKNKGYAEGHNLPKDPNDPEQTRYRLYVLKDGGLRSWVSGIMSTKGMFSKGTSKKPGIALNDSSQGVYDRRAVARINSAVAQSIPHKDFDPRKVNATKMAPLVNAEGDIVNYRYRMADTTKNNLLERDNRFEVILGTFEASTFDKQTTPEHNREAIKLMHDTYREDFTERSESYIKVGPDSTDPELREIYEHFPDETKRDIKEIWGTDHMMIRSDLINISFGYRKLSLSTIFDKEADERNVAENLAAGLVEGVLSNYARVRLGMSNKDAERYAQRAGIVVRRAEDVWASIVGIVKDIIVIRSGVVFMDNVLSNTSVLTMMGVPLAFTAKTHLEAYKGARAYYQDSENLKRLQATLDADYGRGDEAEIRAEITRLKNELARNPVAELLAAGLMPTIVEDIAMSEDPYSYKSRFVRKTEEFTDKLNPTLVKAANTALMNRGTIGHNLMSEATQYSDFMARYTLVEYLTSRRNNPLSKEEAIQRASDTFINYDIPMDRTIQYLDDMGLFMFTKYLVRVQRLFPLLLKENPARMATTLLLRNYFDGVPTIIDSSLLHRHQIIPWRNGALEIFNSADDILTVRAGLSLFR